MNKCDLLERKLKAGVPVTRYMPSYGARANDLPTFSSCAPLPASSPPPARAS